MPSIPDLDAIARKYDTERWSSVIHSNGRLLAPAETPADVAALVAELRAAREVVRATRALLEELNGGWAEVDAAHVAIIAYDEAHRG